MSSTLTRRQLVGAGAAGAALSGLAAFARTPRDFGVAMEGRRWRR